ncbi:MAG TPA: hypothetical protein VNX18_09285 [Bryobacteraceae bacterium]|jgi:hypothetical protein|nr:hypothetical protein [Bryobacteraceae bacterium]
MDQNLLIIIAVFVFVAAVALCIQAGLLFGIYRSARSLEEKTTPLLPKVDALVETSRVAVEDGRKQIQEISVKTNEILDTTRKQLARVDAVMEDAAGRARVQMDRAEMVLDDTMNRAQETVALVHDGIMKPLREIQGVSAGVRAALNFLMRGRNGPVHATADEEMFI